MKLKDLKINEMTMRGPNLDKLATKFVDTNKDKWFTGQHIGDIEQYQIKKLDDYYSVWDRDVIIAASQLDDTKSIPIVDKVWVNKEYRGQKIFSKLLWFYKTRLGYPKLLLGDVHSADMQEVVKGLSNFTKYWVKGDQQEPFNINTLDKFYGFGKSTGWMLMLENTGDFSSWPKFTIGKDWIRENYEWQIE